MLGKTNAGKNRQKVVLTGDATEEFVAEGKTFYSDNPEEKKTGMLQNKNDWASGLDIKSTSQDQYIYIPSGYFDGYATPIKINKITTENKEVTPSNQVQYIYASEADYLREVKVNAIQTQSKTVTPSSSQQIIKPDTGKFLSQVSVNAVPAGIVECVVLSVDILTESKTTAVFDTWRTVNKKSVYVGIVNGNGSIDGSNDNSNWVNLGTYNDGGSSNAYTATATQGYVSNVTYRYIRINYYRHNNGGLNRMFYCISSAG